MMNAYVMRYKRKLERCALKLSNLLEGKTEYKSLEKLLTRYNNSMGRKLGFIISYVAEYIQRDGAIISINGDRLEAMCSYAKLVEFYGSSGMIWYNNVMILSALGLLYIHKPDRHKGDGKNTPAQERSLTRAAEKTLAQGRRHKAVTWYYIPSYTKATLRHANTVARKLLAANVSVTHVTKDVLREVLGARAANTATDTLNGQSYYAAVALDALADVIRQRMREQGYTTPAEVVDEAHRILNPSLCAEQDIDIDEFLRGAEPAQDRQTYSKATINKYLRGHLHHLLTELGAVYGCPPKSERMTLGLGENWHSWIIRHAAER